MATFLLPSRHPGCQSHCIPPRCSSVMLLRSIWESHPVSPLFSSPCLPLPAADIDVILWAPIISVRSEISHIVISKGKDECMRRVLLREGREPCFIVSYSLWCGGLIAGAAMVLYIPATQSRSDHNSSGWLLLLVD